MVKCKYEGNGIWNGRCTGTKEVDPCPGYDKCERFKPDYKTNADRIRAMSDEELAEFIVRKVKDIHHQGMYEVALPAWLKYLKKPSE